MKRLRMVMKKAVDTTVNAMLTRDLQVRTAAEAKQANVFPFYGLSLRHTLLQASLEPLQAALGADAFSQLLGIEQRIANVFKEHAEVRGAHAAGP